jgi:C4-dicarboxylate transporter DctM subunit
VTIWSPPWISSSDLCTACCWTLTALPLFMWMGEILFRTKLSQDMFRAWRPGCKAARAAAAHQRGRLHHLCRGVGLQRRHLRHHRQDDPARAEKRGYPDDMAVGTLAGAGTLGLLIPPSIIMIVYGVAADVSIAKLFMAGVLPGCCWRAVLGLHRHVGAAQPDKCPGVGRHR